MKDIQQLIKKNSPEGRYEDIFPKTFIDAVLDKESGATLTDILAMFNMLFLSYNGSRSQTRLEVPISLRKTGIWITYVLYDKTVITEWYAGEAIDDNSWGDSSNWRVGSNMLVGDISISSDGYWVVNGVITTTKAQGEQGITPMLRVGSNNHLQVSYTNGRSWVDTSTNPVYTQFRVHDNKLEQSVDLGATWIVVSDELAYQFRNSGNKLQVSKDLGVTWEDTSDYIAAWFRFTGTTGSSQADNVGKIQISRDNGVTWSDLSGEFTNSLHIKGYVATTAALPSSAVQGDIYGVGPTYDPSDTGQTNPIYQLYVKDSTGWVNNGKFTSISAGVVQELGDSETKVMSQKAVSEKLSELGSKVLDGGILGKDYFNIRGYINDENLIIDSDNTLVGGFLEVNNGDVLKLELNGLKRAFVLYDSLKSYLGTDGWFIESTSFEIPSNVRYVRIMIRNADSSNISNFDSFIVVRRLIKGEELPITQLTGRDEFLLMSQKAITEFVDAKYLSAMSMTKNVVCTTDSSEQIKVLSIPNLTISTSLRLIVRMERTNTYRGDVSMSIIGDGVYTYPLYYNGSIVSENNTWNDGDYIDVFFSSSAFWAYPMVFVKNEKGTSNKNVMSQLAVSNELDYLAQDMARNVLNKQYFTANKYINDAGLSIDNGNFAIGGLIAVNPNSKIKINTNYKVCVYYYSVSKTYIGYNAWFTEVSIVDIPSNVGYVRIAIKSNALIDLVNFEDSVGFIANYRQTFESVRGNITWSNRNIVGNGSFQNESKRGASEIYSFGEDCYVGFFKTQKTEEQTSNGFSSYYTTEKYAFNVVFFNDDNTIKWESGYTRYNIFVPKNTKFAVVFKKEDNSNVDISILNDVIGIHKEQSYLDIPNYYFDDNYIDNKIEVVDNLIRSCATNGDAFIHISDVHWSNNEQHSPSLIKYITSKLPIKRLFNTGDDFDGTAFSHNSAGTELENVNVFLPFSQSFGGDYHWCVGNHDILNGYKNTYNDLYATHLMLNDKAVFDDNNSSKSYYYVDNHQQQIRYIVLDSFGSGEDGYTHYAPKQLEWLENIALNVDEGWTILIFCHMIYYVGSNFTFSDISDSRFVALKNILLGYEGNGTIAAVFQGDAHVDRIFKLENRIPVICINSDTMYDGQNVERNVGTKSEQCFDVDILDKTNRKIYCVRVGCKARDGVGLTSQGEEVEIREVSY